ncbi:hypothetical protein ACROYT_G035756 [Oculina patagonica]
MLPESDPEIYEEFCKGNWAVNKNPDVPFCALGADHALEQINRSMKVSGGLVGITLNPNARTKFFLYIAPELVRLAKDAKEMAGTTRAKEDTRHHTFRPEIDIQEADGTYEFTVVPRSMFATDGKMLHCPAKSSLMSIPEKTPATANTDESETARGETVSQRMRVSIIDAMAEVTIDRFWLSSICTRSTSSKSMDKPDWIKSCSNLADHFSCRIFEKYGDGDEIRLIFDRYDLPSSLKEATRNKRQGNQHTVYYRITPSTHIAKVTMKKLLSHAYTKNKLAEYFAKRLLSMQNKMEGKQERNVISEE